MQKKGQAFRSEIQGRTLKLYICQLSKSHKFDAHFSIFYLASLHHFGCLISPIEKKQRKINCNAKKSFFLVQPREKLSLFSSLVSDQYMFLQRSDEKRRFFKLHTCSYIIPTSLIYYINGHCFKFATGHKKCC